MALQCPQGPSQANPSQSIPVLHCHTVAPKPSLGSGKFGGNQAKIGRPGVVKGVVHGRRGPHTPTNGLAASPGSRGTQANPSQHAHCRHGRPNHLPVPWGRRTSGTASRQSQATEPARYDAPVRPEGPTVASNGRGWVVGDPGASTRPLITRGTPRSIATPQNSSLASGKFGGNQAKIGRPGVVEGVVRGHGGPHTPTNGIAVSPGSMGTQANPSQHVYCRHGRPNHLPVPWGRRTSGTASRQSQATEPARYDAPCGRRDPQSPQRWPWLGSGDPRASTRPLITRGTPRSIRHTTKTPRSQVANLGEIKPKRAPGSGQGCGARP